MTDNSTSTRWRPDMAEMREWRTGKDRAQAYFLWLQSQNPLPEVPEGEDHPMFADMLGMLRKLHTYDADTLAEFRNGGFGSIHQVEYYNDNLKEEDTSWGQNLKRAKDSREKVRELIHEMLRHTGDFDDAMVEQYYDQLTSEIMSFSGPMA